MDSGDTSWMLVSTALVMLMTPGLGLFYGGMVRSKNVLGTMMHSFMCIGIVSVLWVVCGYSLAFGPDIRGVIGSLDWVGLSEVGMEPGPYSEHVPHIVFSAFQLMFAIITPALITGAFAERMKFSAFILFTVFWSILVYVPVCHWVWGGGWLGTMGALDFAGGTVIHINSGVAALAAALIIGRRRGFGQEPFYPNNITLTMLGAGLLWFGWFGFNAGSAVAANGVAGLAFFNTHVATAAAALSWIVFEQVVRKKPTSLGFASGAVAGLVAITPGAGFVTPVPALAIGFVAGMLCYFAILAKEKLGYDDSLDVVGVHGVGGLWGALATGLFASVGGTGLFYGDPHQFLVQLAGAMAVIVFSFVATSLVLLAIRKFNGLRVDEEDEEQGLDQSIHGETGYYLR
ncbi:MAG TPA: ammonium transporter [Deltaproteobacteria bacterium]|nr:ammonium transporter [Deltaproteobacteria bacterium]HRW80748.1 ammonium transporter [Desulfomonilia bacterium]HNS90388.1 ammonium transporter [Deltaproteobacteria bacterium]HOA44210.1 ammonium transporter [Deltaproteobacteria bacterium]HOC74461.1 ammonium transporter [Deltaproteobacteria bacterium]